MAWLNACLRLLGAPRPCPCGHVHAAMSMRPCPCGHGQERGRDSGEPIGRASTTSPELRQCCRRPTARDEVSRASGRLRVVPARCRGRSVLARSCASSSIRTCSRPASTRATVSPRSSSSGQRPHVDSFPLQTTIETASLINRSSGKTAGWKASHKNGTQLRMRIHGLIHRVLDDLRCRCHRRLMLL
jgi:hypothetical protein